MRQSLCLSMKLARLVYLVPMFPLTSTWLHHTLGCPT